MERYQRKPDLWRPECHFTPPAGWMNDPNGLCFFKGWYHMFYQYNPYGCEWSTMHWGHAVSRDMLHWKDRGIALYPDRPYDNAPEGGCFSGSALVKDGRMYLFYTGKSTDGTRERQTQNMAYSTDGIHFEKYENNPVIDRPPEGMSVDFRDPKVLEVNGRYYMVAGGCTGSAQDGGDGKIYLYESPDLFRWEYRGILLESKGRYGSMFECPDLFPLEERWVITASPMNHPRGNKAIYFTGVMDFDACRFTVETTGNMDVGRDFYAPQSFVTGNGRRVLVGWMNGWPWMPWFKDFGRTGEEGWRGVFTFPRRPYFHQGKLRFLPAAEVRKLESPWICHTKLTVTDQKYLLCEAGRTAFRMEVKGSVKKAASLCLEFGLFDNGTEHMGLTLDFIAGVLTLDLGSRGRVQGVFEKETEEYRLELIADHSLVEIFYNGGEICLSENYYPEKNQTGVWVRTPYRTVEIGELKIARLESVWDSHTVGDVQAIMPVESCVTDTAHPQ